MGKIFDALEKSKQRHKSSGSNKVTNETVLNAKAESQAYVNRPVSLNKDRSASHASYKPLKKVAKLKRQDPVTPLTNDKIMYDINKVDKNLVALLKPQSFENEQFKMLRTNLLFPSSGKSHYRSE